MAIRNDVEISDGAGPATGAGGTSIGGREPTVNPRITPQEQARRDRLIQEARERNRTQPRSNVNTGYGTSYNPGAPGSVNPAFQLPEYDRRNQFIWDQLANINREVPGSQYVSAGPGALAGQTQIQAANPSLLPQLGAAQQMQAAQAGPAALGQASMASAGKIANLSPTQIAQLGAAQQAQDSAVRADQMSALGYQGGLMRGENSIAELGARRAMDEAQSRSLGFQAGARPGQGGTAARLAAQSLGNAQAQIYRDATMAKLAERNAAAGMYGQMASNIRGQDNQLSQYNTGEQNLNQRIQAQFAQGAYGQDSAQAAARAIEQGRLGTQASIANAGYGTQASLANAGMQNDMSRYNAGLQQDASGRNMDASNLRDFQRAGMELQNNQYNTGLAQDRYTNQAGLDQNRNLFNAGQQNDMSRFNAGNEQQNNQFNVQAALQGRGLDDSRMINLFNQGTNLAGMQMQGGMAYNSMLNQNQENMRDRENRLQMIRLQAQLGKQDQPSFWERLGGAALGIGGGLAGLAISGGNPLGAAAGAGIGNGLSGLLGGSRPDSSLGGIDYGMFDAPTDYSTPYNPPNDYGGWR